MATKTQVHSTEYIQVLKSLNYDFKLNETNDRIEVNGEPITDAIEATIFTKLRDRGYERVRVARDAYIAHAYANRYHPVRDYLNSLKYDGKSYIKTLTDHFNCPDGTFEVWLRRWLIGAVRRVFKPGAQNRMLVLDGPQDIGKSKFVEWLTPAALRSKHFFSGPINPDSKDHKTALMERWIWEVAELGATTRRADREALKGFISLEQVTERLPYAHYAIQKPALSSFIGTVNSEGGLLADPTGSRRFMFSKITDIDWQGYTSALDAADIWAEAVMLYYSGEPADLTPDEKKLAEEINRSYETEDPLEGILMQYFEVNPTVKHWWTSSAEILKTIENPLMGAYRANTHITGRQLASLMTKFGCERKRDRPAGYKNPVWGYVGVKPIGP